MLILLYSTAVVFNLGVSVLLAHLLWSAQPFPALCVEQQWEGQSSHSHTQSRDERVSVLYIEAGAQ